MFAPCPGSAVASTPHTRARTLRLSSLWPWTLLSGECSPPGSAQPGGPLGAASGLWIGGHVFSPSRGSSPRTWVGVAVGRGWTCQCRVSSTPAALAWLCRGADGVMGWVDALLESTGDLGEGAGGDRVCPPGRGLGWKSLGGLRALGLEWPRGVLHSTGLHPRAGGFVLLTLCFRAAPTARGSSQAGGPIGVAGTPCGWLWRAPAGPRRGSGCVSPDSHADATVRWLLEAPAT